MKISKGLMALLLAATLTISATSFNHPTYAAETRVGADIVITADTAEDDNLSAIDDEILPTSETAETNAQQDAPLPEMPNDLKAAYSEAIKSIMPFNKLEAVNAALEDVNLKVSKFQDLLAIEAALYQAKGFFSVDSLNDNWINSDDEVAARNQLIAALATKDDGTIDETKQTELQKNNFEDLIKLAKTDKRYYVFSADIPVLPAEEFEIAKQFSELTDKCQTLYDTGVATLRKLLPAVGASPTAIQNMNGEALGSLATSVTEYNSYGFYAADVMTTEDLEAVESEHAWQLFLSYLNAASVWFANQSKGVSEYNTDSLTNAYGRLVAVAQSAQPGFAVDLNKATRLSTLPTLPNTGSLQDGENSASLVALALGGIVSLVTIAGLGLTAKRFLFSPLKRRK